MGFVKHIYQFLEHSLRSHVALKRYLHIGCNILKRHCVVICGYLTYVKLRIRIKEELVYANESKADDSLAKEKWV